MISDAQLLKLSRKSVNSYDFWAKFLIHQGVKQACELGVYRGKFAEYMLQQCPSIETYYMIDPWRHLDDWNKPANVSQDRFEQFYHEVLEKTAPFKEKCRILRGKTTEVIDQIPDGSLDYAYIDGDHTLRGIAIDLIRIYPKIKKGGWIGGDDFGQNIWQHAPSFEPSLVFPFAIHFAEAIGATIYILPKYGQFLIYKSEKDEFKMMNLMDTPVDTSLRKQLVISPLLLTLKHAIWPYYNRVRKLLRH